MTDRRPSRRDVINLSLVGAGGLATLTLARQVERAAAEAETQHAPAAKRSWAMVIDQAKCSGCGNCVLACQASNDVPPDMTWNTLYPQQAVGGRAVYLPVACQHCAHAPCVSVCPVKASYVREDGIVMMGYDRCIGCRYCQVACPYGARTFNWETFDAPNPAVPEWGEPDVARRPRGVVEKCTFCVQRIDRGLALGLTPGVDEPATPACVNACPQGARLFGDLNDPDSNVSRALAASPHYRLKEELGAGPRVYYLPASRAQEG
jgi:phenylacetyl-CoA:acceptor oxidoreductase subunit 1